MSTDNIDRRGTAVCEAFRHFGTSIFTEMTALANRVGAVNLSQGFPDFDGPLAVRQAAADAILKGPNQYAPSIGVPSLRRAVADKMKRFYGVDVDPDTQVTVTAGASEGLTATLLGLLNPGDEVILLEPCYDLYPPIVLRAGATPVYVSLEQPGFTLPKETLIAAFGPRTRAIIVNNPQNPNGKVFKKEELDFIGQLCEQYDAIAIGDEVYEHLIYDNRQHVTLISIPSLAERSVVVSSTAKTFSMTGWKVGYVVASPRLSYAVRMSHQFITYCTPSAFQEAMAVAIQMDDSYYRQLLHDYTAKREQLCSALAEVGFDVLWPEGTYYATVNVNKFDFIDDIDFCYNLVNHAKVAAIPESVFWNKRRAGRELVRFCFCKSKKTLDIAVNSVKKNVSNFTKVTSVS